MVNGFPRVSVVMPAFNVEKYIERAVTSVLDQSFKDLELIVIDDGSKDRTLEMVQALAREDSRLKVIVQENTGRPSIARNRGIAQSTGEYLAFLDSDDFWFPTRVEKMVSGLDQHPEWAAAFHDLKFIAEDGSDLGHTYLADADFLSKAEGWLTNIEDGWFECHPRFYVFMSLYFAAAHTQSIMIARSRLPEMDIFFDPQFIICEDTDLWIRLALAGRLGFLNEVLSGYRQIGTSITRDQLRFASQSVDFHRHNLKRVVGLLSIDEKCQYECKLASYLRDLGFVHFERLELESSRLAYKQALKLDGKMTDLLALGKTWVPKAVFQGLRERSR
jgi:glycosyltransferase involved in cell wall biosynthesis